jgi:hypothetical protein
MLSKADLTHINRLHHVGCQLSILKRLYQSYDLLIDRLLGKRSVSMASLKNSNVLHSGLQSLTSSHPALPTDEETSLGVSLSSAAKVRFERLRHRIQLYALSEVNECLAQKDSLVMMVGDTKGLEFSFIFFFRADPYHRTLISSPSRSRSLWSASPE